MFELFGGYGKKRLPQWYIALWGICYVTQTQSAYILCTFYNLDCLKTEKGHVGESDLILYNV